MCFIGTKRCVQYLYKLINLLVIMIVNSHCHAVTSFAEIINNVNYFAFFLSPSPTGHSAPSAGISRDMARRNRLFTSTGVYAFCFVLKLFKSTLLKIKDDIQRNKENANAPLEGARGRK